jgi:hypothetical protein
MPQRLAVIVALLAFAVCLFVGGIQVGNPFTTTVGRALAAMAGTYVVGLIVGMMGRRAIEENLAVVPPPPAAPPSAPGPAVKAKPVDGR